MRPRCCTCHQRALSDFRFAGQNLGSQVDRFEGPNIVEWYLNSLSQSLRPSGSLLASPDQSQTVQQCKIPDALGKAHPPIVLRLPGKAGGSPVVLGGGISYVMDFVASRKTANPTGTKASSWLERVWIV